MELIAVTAGGISVYTYGLINLAAILAGLLAACGNFRLHGQDWKRLEDLLLWGLPLSLLAGRLAYVLCHWNEFSSAPLTTLCFWHGGISYYGVIPALFFTVFAYCQIHGFNPWRWMDLLIPAFLLATAVQDLSLSSLQTGAGTSSLGGVAAGSAWMEYIEFQFRPLNVQEMGHFHSVMLRGAQAEALVFLLISFISFWQSRHRTPWKDGSVALLGIGLVVFIRFCCGLLV